MANKIISTTVKKKNVFDDYDYEASFNQNLKMLSESFIEGIFRNRHVGVNYTTKTIQSGNLFEVEIFPHFSSKNLPKGIIRKGETKQSQRNLNDANSRKKLRRIVHHNFGPGDYWCTFTFSEEELPKGFSELAGKRKLFFEKINRLRKNKGLEGNARYVYVEEEGEYGTERFHLHIIMDSELTKEEVESKWTWGRVNIRTINYHGDRSMMGLCKYICKDPETYKKTAFRIKGKRKWGRSKGNLTEPIPSYDRSFNKFNKKKVNQLARNQNSIEEVMENTYPNYYFKEAELKYNEETGLFYIYVLMHDKRNIKSRR